MNALSARIVERRGDFTLDIELTIEPGQTAALLGPNGSGKSTTVDVLAGIAASDAPASTTLIALGDRVLHDAASGVFLDASERRIGVVFQGHVLFEHLSVAENVAFGLRSAGVKRVEARRRADEWLERVGLGGLGGERPAALSGGQAQRVAIARALAFDPDLLLFDEPLAALDVETRVDMQRLLREHLDGFAGPRLLITHTPSDAFLLADVIHVIEHGRIVQSGTPDDIRRHPATAYVAALAETNLLLGTAMDGTITLDGGAASLTVADRSVVGDVAVTIPPRAVSLHVARPEGSQRNAWRSTVDYVEPLGDIVRITLGAPVPISVDITPGSVTSLGLEPGSSVWAAVKATELSVTGR